MRFASAHKLVTYLLVLAALTAVATTGALSPASALAFVVACVLSFRIESGSRTARALDRAATVVRFAGIALFGAIAWRLWRRLPDPDVSPAFDLVLALLGYKLFFRRAHRDYVHVAALTFLLVLVASTIAHNFVFVATFAVYVVVAVWALILFHLRREMEENYLIKHSAQAPSQKVGVGRILGSRRVVGGSFFVATAGMAAAVFVGAVAIFMLVPRVGAGFAVGVTRVSGSAAGFADEIAIGRYGTRPAHRRDVVLRATLPELHGRDADASARTADGLYFRGAAYDGYAGGRWVHTHRPELRTVVERDGGRFVVGEAHDAPNPVVTSDLRQEIEAIGIPASVLVAIDRPRAFELPSTKLGAAGALSVFPRWSGEAALRVGGGQGDADAFITLSHAHYVAYSRIAADVSAAGPLSPAARAAYLAVPEDLKRRLGSLAATLGDPDLDETDSIAAITRALREKHGYTLEPSSPPAGVDPVESFLLGEHPGHCELFASAAVLLLRVRGVPARYVTGFRGGEWNAVGDYVAVRDDRAHAWAEAFVPERGWIRVDATPPGPPLPRAGRLSEIVDALDYFWNRWVVGYDLGRQLELARRAGRHIVTPAAHANRSHVTWFVTAACLLPALLLLARRLRRRRAQATGDTPATSRASVWTAPRVRPIDRLYRRTLGRLARAGCPRQPNETPHEYAQRVCASGLLAPDDFSQLTERYAAARFGGHHADDKVVAQLAAKLAIRTGGAGHPGSAPPEPRG